MLGYNCVYLFGLNTSESKCKCCYDYPQWDLYQYMKPNATRLFITWVMKIIIFFVRRHLNVFAKEDYYNLRVLTCVHLFAGLTWLNIARTNAAVFPVPD